jgi:5-methylcytosine-specific restriction enzyme subunit McrC
MIRMGVSSNRPTHAEMSMLRLSRHDAEDRLMLSYARLVFELEIPTEEAGSRALPIAERDDTDSYLQWIYSLYERAVYGFYDYVLTPQGWTVSHGDILKWPEPKLSKGMKAVLPRMKTDIVLEHKIDQRRIVIDTKFNPLLKEGQYDKMTLKSTYLYQIYAYLRSQEDNDNELVRYSEGLMLHPSTDEMFDEALELQGHLIRFATVDLSAPAPTIREQLLRVVATPDYAVEYSEN